MADEIDDAVGALRMYSLGLAAEIGLVVGGTLGIGAIAAAIAAGAEAELICSATIVLSLAGALKIRGSQLQTGR